MKWIVEISIIPINALSGNYYEKFSTIQRNEKICFNIRNYQLNSFKLIIAFTILHGFLRVLNKLIKFN